MKDNNIANDNAAPTSDELTDDGWTQAAKISFASELKGMTVEMLRSMLEDQKEDIRSQVSPDSPYALMSFEQARMIQSELNGREVKR